MERISEIIFWVSSGSPYPLVPPTLLFHLFLPSYRAFAVSGQALYYMHNLL